MFPQKLKTVFVRCDDTKNVRVGQKKYLNYESEEEEWNIFHRIEVFRRIWAPRSYANTYLAIAYKQWNHTRQLEAQFNKVNLFNSLIYFNF